MPPIPEQPLKVENDPLRELENIHRRINDLLVDDGGTDLEEAYVAGELDTEAEIIAALNATNARINLILAKIRFISPAD